MECRHQPDGGGDPERRRGRSVPGIGPAPRGSRKGGRRRCRHPAVAERNATLDREMTSAATPMFRGWLVVAAAFSILFLSYGLQFSYGVFVSGMSAELGWSRAATALPYSIYV